MTTMLAGVLHDFNKLKMERVPKPAPTEPGEVVVKIKSCGICATDYKAIKGIRTNVSFPFIPGHEPSGIVESIGPGVTHYKVGDEVICQPSGFCGFCKHCRVGNTHYCEHAFTTGGDGPEDVWAGAFAEYMKTKEVCLFGKPKNISFDAAALTEPLSGAWKGIVQYSQLQVGEDVIIIGVGSIGLLCLMVAKAAGAGRLIAIDTNADARAKALTMGATHVVDPSAGDPVKAVYDIIPEGPDLVVEAAGPIQAVKLMVDLRRRGTRWNIFGITTHEKFELDGGYTHFLEGRMDASFGTNTLAMQRAIRLIETGLVDPGRVISHHFSLEKLPDAIDAMSGRNRNKIIIHPG
jgi:threonine dehydrogenase-like Zn-dependent dehydrogenase